MKGKRIFMALLMIVSICIPMTAYADEKNPVEQTEPALPEGYTKAAENDKLLFSVNEETLDISVLNKESGFEWSSTEITEDTKLNDSWKAFALSGVTVGYYNSDNMLQQEPYVQGENQAAITYKDNGFSADISFEDLKISFQLSVTLSEDSLEIRVPGTSIKEGEPEKYALRHIILYPFLGASQGLTEGEMLIPDGSGALIDLSRKTMATQAFSARFYGDDIGIFGENGLSKNNNTSKAAENLAMPVYGVSYNSNDGCLTYLKEGAEYAELNVYLSGITTPYNFLYSSFIYRDTYQQPISRNTAGVPKVQKSQNQFDIDMKLMFLEGSGTDYSDMSVRYRKELIEDGTLDETASDEAKMRIEFLMADNVESMLGKEVIPMTTAAFCKDNIEALYQDGIQDLSIGLKGYTKGGLTDSSVTYTDFEKKTGSAKDYKKLFDAMSEMDMKISLDTDYAQVYQKGSGYSKKDIARTIAEQFIAQGERDFSKYYILSPVASEKLYEKQQEKFEELGVSSMAMQSIGNILYSSYVSNPASRSETIEIYKKMLQKSELPVLLYQANQYLWNEASEIAYIPMGSSGYLFTTETVPFMQMVLKGNVTMYTSPQNLNIMGRENVLKLVDYGVNPDYLITENDPIELYQSDSSEIFTSQYQVWKEDMTALYKEVIPVLKKVEKAAFRGRKKLAESVYQTTYSNGVSIVINYSPESFSYEGTEIEAESFVLMQKGEAHEDDK